MNAAKLQLIIVLASTALFTLVGIWWLRTGAQLIPQQLPVETTSPLREIVVTAKDTGLTVGTLEIRTQNGVVFLSLRANLLRPVTGSKYQVIGINGSSRKILGSMELGNGQQYFLTTQQPDPLPYSELHIELASTEDENTASLLISKITL